jgi:bifunctional UDP-N-acetylglucosamine pyrophosphorylase/glucosamine-1-phosphate N-acetyltransferase
LLATATLRNLLAFHRKRKASATVLTADLPDPAAYGRILRAEDGSLAGIVELKAASEEQKKITEINTGIYCFEVPALFDALKKVKKNPASGEYYLTDVIELLRKANRRLAACKAADRDEITGINDRAELARVDSILRLRKATELMLAGVTIHLPESVRIDPQVQVGQDSTLEAGVYIRGQSVIGSKCVIGAYSVITDSTIDDEVTIRVSSVITESKIERGAQVGPFANLRPGAHICEGAHIGDFVEVKKSKIGRRTKANHLAYIGDATIGEDVNVGAGTITVNYDGVNKHQTLIGNRAFIGSGSELIAPVEIGDEAFVAAGSTIHDHVPAGALAIARARQAVKPGWMVERTRKLKQAKSARKQ